MKKLVYRLMILLLFVPVFTYAQQTKFTKVSLEGEEVQRTSPELKKTFKQFDTYQLDFSEIKEKAKANDEFEVSLKMGDKHQWNLLLVLNDMRPADFKETIPTENGVIEIPRRRAITYKGYINNPGSLGEEVRMNISDDFINGYVTINGVEHFIEPATLTDRKAPKDHFVIYRPQDVITSEDNQCSLDQAKRSNAYEEGEIEFDQKQHKVAATCLQIDFATACTWDFVQTQSNDPVMANNRIAAITNLVEGLYSPFMLEYVIVSQFAPGDAASDPFTSSIFATTILADFNTWAQTGFPTHDLGQIWVGRNISGCGNGINLIGCAQCIGCICETNRYNVCENSWTQNTNCLRTLSAHECGHNWDGVHSQSAPGSIMTPIINCGATTFTPGNITRIQNHIDSRTCLDPCCELVVDCSNIEDQRVLCHEDVPPANYSLPIIVSSCGPVTITHIDLSTVPPGPGVVIRQYTITDSEGNTATCSQTFQINGIGFVELTQIDNVKNPCLEAEVCFKGEYRLCNGVNGIPPTELVFKENSLTVATAPITLNSNGTWSECFTKKQLIMMGLETNIGYDVCVRLNTDAGVTLVSPAFVIGLNNDFKFGAYYGEITSVPDCVQEGVPFNVVVEIDGWILGSEFTDIYSADNLYTYVGPVPPFVQWTLDGKTRMVLSFVSNTCTCAGEILTFDIRINGCAIPVWLMTDPIPCCAKPCEDIVIKDWEAGDCFYYNGNLARPFTLYVSSPTAIFDAIAQATMTTCATSTENVVVTPVGPGLYMITGYIVFDDPACTFQADVLLALQTKGACCTIEQQFSFPKGCTFSEGCDVGPADVQLIYDGNPPTMTVSLNLPAGTVVTVTNNTTGGVTTAGVGTIQCGPFWIDQNGNVGGGTNCNGIKFNTPGDYDCREPIAGQNTEYSYTITYGDCIWVITGDYCRETTVYKSVVSGKQMETSEEASQERSDPETEPARASLDKGTIKVYPNPIQSSGLLNFDLTQLNVAVKTIRITDMSGKLIETITPQEDNKIFSHQLTNDLVQGVYFVIFGLEDGSMESKKLISLE